MSVSAILSDGVFAIDNKISLDMNNEPQPWQCRSRETYDLRCVVLPTCKAPWHTGQQNLGLAVSLGIVRPLASRLARPVVCWSSESAYCVRRDTVRDTSHDNGLVQSASSHTCAVQLPRLHSTGRLKVVCVPCSASMSNGFLWLIRRTNGFGKRHAVAVIVKLKCAQLTLSLLGYYQLRFA